MRYFCNLRGRALLNEEGSKQEDLQCVAYLRPGYFSEVVANFRYS